MKLKENYNEYGGEMICHSCAQKKQLELQPKEVKRDRAVITFIRHYAFENCKALAIESIAERKEGLKQ